MSMFDIYRLLKVLRLDIQAAKILVMFTFGERLRAWRESKGFTLYRLQKLTGTAQPNLTSIEKNRRGASPDVKEQLVAVEGLGLTMDRLKAWERLDGASREELKIIKEELKELGI